jgi:hypothetical protein
MIWGFVGAQIFCAKVRVMLNRRIRPMNLTAGNAGLGPCVNAAFDSAPGRAAF